MTDVTIRQVSPSEYDVAGSLVVDAYRTLEDSGDEPYERVLRDVAERVRTGQVLVAELDNQIIGCVTLSVGQTDLSEVDDADAATVRMLGVSPRARGRGVGEALMTHCIRAASAAGAKRVRLDTRTSMGSAQRLYQRLGFERDPKHDWSPAPGIFLLAYVLELHHAPESSSG